MGTCRCPGTCCGTCCSADDDDSCCDMTSTVHSTDGTLGDAAVLLLCSSGSNTKMPRRFHKIRSNARYDLPDLSQPPGLGFTPMHLAFVRRDDTLPLPPPRYRSQHTARQPSTHTAAMHLSASYLAVALASGEPCYSCTHCLGGTLSFVESRASGYVHVFRTQNYVCTCT